MSNMAQASSSLLIKKKNFFQHSKGQSIMPHFNTVFNFTDKYL